MPARWRRWAADSRRADRSERLRRYWDRQATPTTSYDRQIAFFERSCSGTAEAIGMASPSSACDQGVSGIEPALRVA